MLKFPCITHIIKDNFEKFVTIIKSCSKSVYCYFSYHSIRYFIGIAAVILAIFALIIPSAYVIEEPGPTQDVMGKIDGLEVINIKTDASKKSGKLLLLTVGISGVPGYETSTLNAITSWLNPNRDVLPRELIVPIGQTANQYEEESENEMNSSQDSAIKAAKNKAKELGLSAEGKKISLHVEDIGGPSAGMIYTLGILNKLSKYDITGGKVIAGTGTIDEKGNVGEIGGIRLKMIGAKRDGATWFLAPESNCDEVVGHIPNGMRVVKVATIDEALKALEVIRSGKDVNNLPACRLRK